MSSSEVLLVLTATLGRSPWLHSTVSTVAACAPGPVRHVLIAPEAECRHLALAYPQLQVVPDAGKAGGLYGALNAGLASQAKEPWGYMTFLADDDYVLPGFAEVVTAARQKPSTAAHVVQGDVVMVRENGERLCRVPRTYHPSDIAALVASGISPFNQQGMIYTREAVRRAGAFDAAGKICSDASHWLAALEKGAHFHALKVEAGAFRVRRGQLSGNEALHRAEFADLAARARRLHPHSTRAARWRFRWDNLGAYLERVLRVGWRGGFRLLEGDA